MNTPTARTSPENIRSDLQLAIVWKPHPVAFCLAAKIHIAT